MSQDSIDPAEAFQSNRSELVERLAQSFADRQEIARILDEAAISRSAVRTDLAPLVTWHHLIRELESAPEKLRILLAAVQRDYPDDLVVRKAVDAIDTFDLDGLSLASEAASTAGARDALYGWLSNTWRNSGPCVCCVQGFSGIGKSHTADRLIAARAFENAVLIEVPNGGAALDEVLLLVNEAFARDLDSPLPLGGDLATGVTAALRAPILLVIDEFQNCLDLYGRPSSQLQSFFESLRVPHQQGRVLLLSSRAVDEAEWESLAVRTLGALSVEEGRRILRRMLSDAGRESEVPERRVDEVVEMLAGNPRAMKMLVATLRHFPLEELIEFNLAESAARGTRFHPELAARLERKLVRKTLESVGDKSRDSVRLLSVFRRSFTRGAIETIVGSSVTSPVLEELIDNFLIERRSSWYSLNPVVREVSQALLREDRSRYLFAHRAAGDHYARPFKAKRASATRNASNFIEAEHHLMAAGRVQELIAIARMYAIHIQWLFETGRLSVPADPDELDRSIAMLNGALSGGSPSPGLHVYLAKLLIARAGERDLDQAKEELGAAIGFAKCPADAWSLLLRLGEIDLVLLSLAQESSAVSLLDHDVYLKAASTLRSQRRNGDATRLLRAGIERLGPEHGVFSLYMAAVEILAAGGERTQAVELLRAGITRVGPEHNVFSLYQTAAEILAAGGDRTQAVELLRAGITRVGPEHNVFSLYQTAAEILAAGGERTQAVELLRAGITRVGPEHSVSSLYQTAAEILAAGGERTQAVELLRAGITRVGPEHSVSSLYQTAAEILAAGGDRTQAVELLRAGITRVGPEHNVSSLYIAAAEILAAGGDRDRTQAVELLRAGITRVGPEHNVSSLYIAAAEILAAGGDRTQAVELLRAGITRVGPEHNVSSLYIAAAEILAAGGDRTQAVELLRAGITRVGPEHSVSSLYMAAAEILAAGGERDRTQAVELLNEALDRLPEAHWHGLILAKANIAVRDGNDWEATNILVSAALSTKRPKLAAQALLVAFARQESSHLHATRYALEPVVADNPGLQRLVQCLSLQLNNEWAAAAAVPLDVGTSAYGTLLRQALFSALCAGDTAAAIRLAGSLQERRGSNLSNWIGALVARQRGDWSENRRCLQNCLGRPLTSEEEADELLWIRVWARASGATTRPSFYFPRLPAVLTRLGTDLTIWNSDEFLGSIGRQE